MRTDPSSIVGSCDTGKGADSTQTENSREFPWSAGITILWSAVVAVVSLVIALAAGLGVSLVEILFEPDFGQYRDHGPCRGVDRPDYIDLRVVPSTAI